MKKMKFTLGLMLSMLILGANVAYAQSHGDYITVTASVQGCNFYHSSVTIDKVIFDPGDSGGVGFPSYTPEMIFAVPGIRVEGKTYSHDPFTWAYGAGPGAPYDWTFTPANLIEPSTSGAANLFYLRRRAQAQAFNLIKVELDYKNGNELMPLIKRTMKLGNWSTDFASLVPTDVVVIDYIRPDSAFHFRPSMDRKTETALYYYKDQILPLMDKYNIMSIDYEITIHDEFDSPGINYYQPPLGTDVRQTRAFQIIAEQGSGIKVDPRLNDPDNINDVHRIETFKDLVFKVYSAEPFQMTIEPLLFDWKTRKEPGGVQFIEEDGYTTVIIKQVQSELRIVLAVVEPTNTVVTYITGDEGDVGNAAISADAVWAAGGTLFVQAANPGTLSIYSVTGQLYNQIAVSGSYSLALPKGLFIVQLNGKAYKVIN